MDRRARAPRPADRVVAGAPAGRPRRAHLLARRAGAGRRRAPRRQRAARSRHVHRELPRGELRRRRAGCASRCGERAPSISRTTRASSSRRPSLALTEPGRPADGGHRRRGRAVGRPRDGRVPRQRARERDALPAARPSDGEPSGPVDAHHRVAARRPEEGARRDRRARDDRGAAWNNRGRRHGARQRGEDAQAQVRRPRHAAAGDRPASDTVPLLPRVAIAAGARCRAPRALAAGAPSRAARRPTARSRSTTRPTPATSTTRRRSARSPATSIITQGTLTIRADKIVFQQNPTTRCRRPRSAIRSAFRQKRDGIDEYFEGFAQRVEYDGAKELLELFDRALLRRGQDEIRSNYISYNAATEMFKAEGRADATPAADTRRPGRARARRVPAEVRYAARARQGQGRGEGAATPAAHAAGRRPDAAGRAEARGRARAERSRRCSTRARSGAR